MSSPSDVEKVSNNARFVLVALFVMVGAIVAILAFVLVFVPAGISEGMAGIFSTAITGAFTLGGVLVQNLWGK